MSDFDLDRLGDLWRAEPDPKEMERLQRSAAGAARRARWGQVSDYLLTAIVSLGIVLLVWSDPSPRAGLIGGAAIVLMLVSTIHQRRLRQAELRAITGTSVQMLDQSIERLQATRKRSIYGLLLAIPSILIGIGFGASLESGGGALAERLREIGLASASAVIAAAFLIVVGFMFISERRSSSELARLIALREAYREESENLQE